MKNVKGVLKEDVRSIKHELIKTDNGMFGSKTLHKTIKKGVIVDVTIYGTQNCFLGMPYYDIVDEEGFFCKVNAELLDLNTLGYDLTFNA